MKINQYLLKTQLLSIIILFIFPLISASQDKEITLSPRIGNEINLYTKNYFNLFPMIDNFFSAKFYTAGTNHYTIIIKFATEANHKDSSISISDTLFNDLKFYIENFEPFYLKVKLQKKIKSSNFWKIIRPRLRFYTNSKINWNDYLDSSYRGQLLFVQDEYFVAWMTDSIYNWTTFDENIKFVYFREVESINSTLIEGNFSKFNKIANSRNFEAGFQNYYSENDFYLPYELKKFIEKEKVKAPTKNYFRKNMENLNFVDSINVFKIISISININRGEKIMTNNVKIINASNLIPIENIDNYQPNLSSYSVDCNLFFNVKPWVGGGISLNLGIPNSKTAQDQLLFNSNSINAYLKFYLLKKYNTYLFFENMNLNLLLGLNYAYYVWQTDKFDKHYYNGIYNTTGGYPYEFANTKFNFFGLSSHVSIAYFISTRYSVEINFGFLYYPQNFQLFKELKW
ncbi:MAG: hypothetical protein NT007_05270 [Candidatus Kapabacteria bacterium]|nr:hypothetical protein [Candidatus Kapabacteria bacterium]